MSSLLSLFPVVLTSAAALSLATVPQRGGEVELDDAEVFIEFNSTDSDFGIQFFWDGVPWDRMTVEGPDEKVVLKVKTSRNLQAQGLTEGFFESAEPPTSVLTMAQFLRRFPEGTYDFDGRTLQGEELEGEADFTHVLPAPPSNLSPATGSVVEPSQPLVLSFDAVTTSLTGEPLEPDGYEIILEEIDGLNFVIELDGGVANPSVTVPAGFLRAGSDYKFEVIAQEESGNRTISETAFSAAPSDSK